MKGRRAIAPALLAAAWIVISSGPFSAQSLDCCIWATTPAMWEARLALRREARAIATRSDCLALGSRLAARIGLAPDSSEHLCRCVCEAEFASPQTGWQLLAGAARDVAARRGEIWIVGTNPVPGGFGLYRWDGAGWRPMPGGGVAIAVDEALQPWLVNDRGGVYRWTGQRWTMLPGAAVDVGAGPADVWIIGTNPVPGGFGIYRWAGTGWVSVPGGAVRIAVDSEGAAWVVNDSNRIYRWNGGDWTIIPGAAIDVGAGTAGVWIVGTNAVPGGFGVYRWDRGAWTAMPGGALRVAVGNEPWAINEHQLIWSWR